MSSKVEEFGLPSSPAGRFELPGGSFEPQEGDVQPLSNGLTVLRRNPALYRPAQLAEDETVLACCHHAHEVARAHGAREVMLEHLVHALARVAHAAAVLEDRGINVEALRRDSAAVISSEIPVDQAMTYGQLRASRDFNTVMFLAAAGASHRDERATGVRDVLEALLKYDPKSRAVRLVKRHGFGADIEERADPAAEIKTALERALVELRDVRLALADLKSSHTSLASEVASDRLMLGDRLKLIADSSIASRSDAGALQRLVQERLQTIERAAASGGGSQLQTLVGERFLQMQKAVDGQRMDTQRMEASLAERLKGLERALDVRLADAMRSWAERLATIEQALGAMPAGAGAATELGSRLALLQKGVESSRADWQRLEAGQGERLRAFERTVEQQSGTLARSISGLGERLGQVEASVRTERTAPGAEIETRIVRVLDAELDEVKKALVALGHAQHTLSSAIDEWRLNNSGDLSIISNRLQELERSGANGTGASAQIASATPVEARPTVVMTQASLSPPQSAILDKVDRALKSRYNSQ